ncbi:zinc-binding dehydrogenase [Photobacterium sp. DNB23_23_1]
MKGITYDFLSDSFEVNTLNLPLLETDYDVLIKVHAVSLNPVDAKINYWFDGQKHKDNTFVGGVDISGEIVEKGSRVENWELGERIICHGNMFRRQGGFAEFSVQDSRAIVKHPKVDSIIAASIPCAGWTAYRSLADRLRISERKSIFIAGGSGGVGSFAIQIAKFYGVETIITTCSKQNHDYVRALGATHAIDYVNKSKEQLIDELLAIGEVDLALDAVGGDYDYISANVLKFEGEMIELVKTVEPRSYETAFSRGLTFHQLSLGSGHQYGMDTFRQAGDKVSELIEAGHLTVPRLEVVSLEDIPMKLIEMRNKKTVGKIVAKL